VNSWRSRRVQDLMPEPPADRDPENEATPARQDSILHLQRTVGNRAVQEMLPRSEGESIPEGDREKLESTFGHDLGNVMIHRDEEAAEFAENAAVNAFTAGRDIYFARGAYGPATLAHEVSHVIQQAQGPSVLTGEDAHLEHEADVASSSHMSGKIAEVSSVAAAPALQRQAMPGTQPTSTKLLPTDSVTLDGFDIDKSILSGTHKQKLETFAKRLKATLASSPNSIVTIVGYADAPGTEPHNLALGQQRADAVRDYLVGLSIEPGQLHTISMGEALPLIASKGYEAQNRRVEIDVVERSFFKSQLPAQVPSVPVQPPPVEKPKIDLTFHPKEHEATPSEQFQERMRQVDKAVREAQEAEKANQGTSAADAMGRVLRNAAKKLGLPNWLQDRAESLGKDIPSMGAKAAVDQIAGDKHLDANALAALKALVDAVMQTKVK
jgi:outer membrane protein OmpA-like peptidoglycan-associated protein